MKSLRCVLSVGLSFSMLLSLLPFVSATTTLNVNSFTINSTTSPVTVSPGDSLNLNSNVLLSGGDATNIGFHLDLPASGFNYSGGADTQLWWSPEITDLPLASFNPPTDQDAPLTSSGNASDGDFIDILHIGFTVNSDISTYSNTFSANYFSDETTGASVSRTVYVDVKPHITSAVFAPTSIPNDGSGSTTLTLNVKDFNGCSNIDSATVTADLTSLGGTYTTTENLSYVSCDEDTDTAIYEKTGITTSSGTGSKTITFTTTDEDGNVNDPTDANFGSIDLNPASLTLTVNDATAPTVTALVAGDDYIGGDTQTSTTLSWTGSADTEEYKVVVGNFADCSGGTTVVDWTSGGNGDMMGISLNASAMSEGSNIIYVCGAKNARSFIGGTSMVVTKDTTSASLQKLTISPASVTTQNVTFNWTSNEIGTYATKINDGGEIGSTIYGVANQNEATTFVNASLDSGSNTIYVYFYDQAGNQTIISGNVTKTSPPPSMVDEVGTVTDTDNLYNAIDGRDFTVTWNAVTYNYFESYRIYILPQGVALTGSHSHVGVVPYVDTTTWTGDSMITTDSAGNPFVEGDYIAYVLVRSTAGESGTAGVSSAGTITSDVVSHPSLVDAEFNSDTTLRLEYDIDLSTTITDHDATKILSKDFTVNSSCNGNSNGVYSVSGKYITICINSLATQEGSTAAGLAKKSTVIGQIDSLVPANVEIGDIFQFTATGSSAIASFVATDTTVANVTAGLASAINSADFSDIVAGGLTAVDMTTYVKVYATDFNTAFTSNLTTTDGGGIDTQILQLQRNMQDAVRSDGSGYNCHVSVAIDSGMVGCLASDIDKGVDDAQKPTPLTIGNLELGDSTYVDDDVDIAFSGNITMNFVIPEQLNSNSRIKIEATGGSPDPNSPHSIPMGSYLTASGYQVTLNVGDLLSDSGTTTTDVLNSGTKYKLYILAYDTSGNSNQSNIKTNITYDTSVPSTPVPLHFPNQAQPNGQHTNDTTPLLNWFSATDNVSSSGGILYNLEISLVPDFAVNAQTFSNLTGTSQELGLLDTDSTYYWRVNAEDEAGNLGNYQTTTEYFVFDSTAPILTGATLTDSDLGSTLYTKNGDNVVLTMTLNDTNRDVITPDLITADFSSLGGGVAVSPTTYVGATGVATWSGITVTCVDGAINLPIDATDLAGNPATRINATITCDNTAPTLATGTITAPNGAENWAGGSTQEITWNTGDITETNLVSLTLEYSADNGTNWTEIATGETNDGTYSWDPIPNLDSGQMLVRLIAIDQVTQTGSDVSDATFVIDSTDPTITASTLTAPNGGEFLAGGATTNLTWVSGEITDTYLNANPITLDYFDGSDWVEIANTQANNGTFTWNPIPSLNISNAQVRITAYDSAGNSASDTADAVFTIDSTLPSVSSAETQDLDGNGQIDAIKFTFTENILDSSVTAGNFDIDGYTAENFSSETNGDTADNDVIYITIDESGSVDSGVTPNYTYTQGTLTDFSGNFMSNVGATATTDKAKPIVISRETQDANSDGQLDGVLVTFSENMDASTTESTDFALKTENAVELTETYSDSTDDTTLFLGFSDGAGFDTADLTQVKLSGNFQDLAGNTLDTEGSFTEATDNADPIFSAQTWIATITPAIKVSFSEEVDSLSDDFTDWTVAGFNVIAMDSLDGTTTSVLLSLDANITDTSITPDVTYTAGDIVDSNANALPTSTHTATDSLVPTVSSIEIHDTDSDGNMETAYIQFTENVDDSTLTIAGFTLGNVTADNLSTNAFGVNTADDAKIAISLNTGISGTETQDVLYTASIGGLKDLATTPNAVQNILTADVIEQDKAGPALISATYDNNGTTGDVTDDEITLIFSENLDDTTVNTGAGNSDLEFTVANGGNISNSTTTSDSANDEILIVNLDTGDTALTVATSTVALLSGVLADAIGNTNTNVAPITINGSVVINEIMWMGTTLDAADEFIELRNMSASAVDISGWVIENAGNGGNLTIPASSTIPGDGYFLIANFAAGSSQLDIVPDWVTTTLDLADSANGNLVLKDSSAVVMDSAKGDTWPAGDSVNKYSMERNLAPGNGLIAGNWHDGDAQTNWDEGATEKGTPGAENVADAQAPSFQLSSPDSRLPAHNSLYPTTLPLISVEYEDNDGGSGIDTSATQVFIDLNNDTDYDDEGEEITSLSTITATQISYEPTSDLTAGKHTVKVIIQDIAGNTAQTEWSFWLDNLTMTVENVPTFNLIAGNAGQTILDSQHAKVTVTTYGAGVNLKGYLPLLTSGGYTIQNWDSDTGIGWDVKEDAGAFSGTINPLGNTAETATTLATKAKLADGDFTSQTYTFYVKIYGNVNVLQQAGIYQNNLQFLLDLEY